MSIQQTPDILFDVVKAADVSRAREVIGKLRALSSGDTAAFGTSLAAADTQAATPARTDAEAASKAAALLPAGMAFSGTTLVGLRNAHALSQQRPVATAAASGTATPDQAGTLRKFEGMMLAQFIDAMMPASKGLFGSGTAGSTWRTLLTEKLGTGMAEAGGIGMANRLASASTALNAHRATKGTVT